MTVIPTCLTLVPCSLPSSTLRAGCAGGLRQCLTAAARDTAAEPGRGRETVLPAEQRNIHRGSIPTVAKGAVPDVAGHHVQGHFKPAHHELARHRVGGTQHLIADDVATMRFGDWLVVTFAPVAAWQTPTSPSARAKIGVSGANVLSLPVWPFC